MAQITVEVRGDNNSQRLFSQVGRDIDELNREQTRFNNQGVAGLVRLQAQYAATSFAVFGLARAISSAFRASVQAAANYQAVGASLASLGVEGETAAQSLVDIARAEDGLTFENLRRATTALVGAGLQFEQATDLTRGFARQLAIVNASAEDQSRFFLQLTQAYAGNVAEGNDLRTIFEVMPQLLRIGTQALGIQLNTWKDLGPALETAGISLREFLQLSSEVAGQDVIDPNQFRIQQERLSESVEQLARVIGQQLLPILTQATRGLTGFINTLSADLRGFTLFTAGAVAASVAVAQLAAVIGRNVGFVLWRRSLGRAVTLTQFFRSVIGEISSLVGGTFIVSLRNAINAIAGYQIALSVAIPIIAATTVAIGAIAVAMRNAEDRTNSLTDALGAIGEGIRFDETLQRVRRFTDFTAQELRQGLNNLITEKERVEQELAEPPEIGFFEGFGRNAPASRTQQRVEQQAELTVITNLIERFRNLIQIRENETQAANSQEEQYIGLRAEVTRLTFEINRSQEALRNISNRDEIQQAQADLRRLIQTRFAYALFAAQDIEDENRRRDSITRIREQLQDDLTRVERLGTDRRNTLIDEDRDRRLASARAIRDALREGTEEAVRDFQRLSQVLRTIENINVRRVFADMVNELRSQGVAIEDAIRQLDGYLEVFRAVPRATNASEVALNSFNRELNLFRIRAEGATSQLTQLRDAMREVFRLATQTPDVPLLPSIFAEEDAFRGFDPGDISELEQLRVDARAQGLQFVRRLFQAQLSEEESNLEESLNRQFRQYQRFYTRISDLAVDALFGRIESFREVALRLFEEILRGVLRVEITERITAARTLAIDTALTNARIANQQRLQSVIQGTQATNIASAGGGSLPVGSLPSLSGSLSGGVGALGLASLLFPTEFRNLGQGIGGIFSRVARAITRPDALASQVESGTREFILSFDDGTVRKVTGRQRSNANRRR